MNYPRRHVCWQSRRRHWAGSPGESSRVRGPGGRLCTWLAVRVYVRGFVSGSSLADHSDPASFLMAPSAVSQHGFQRGGFWEDTWAGIFSLLWTFPDSSGWWWLVSSVFLTRTSCCEMTHANGYCGSWPGWVVSVTVFPNSWANSCWQDECFMENGI